MIIIFIKIAKYKADINTKDYKGRDALSFCNDMEMHKIVNSASK